MEVFLAHMVSVWYKFIFAPMVTVIIVEVIKTYTKITEKINPRYLSWLISTVLFAIIVVLGIEKIESPVLLNIIGPGILTGMISNSFYDLGV